MAKLIRKSDGSIAFEHEEGSIQRTTYTRKKELMEQGKCIGKKEFRSLSQAEKDGLMELLLRIHDLI